MNGSTILLPPWVIKNSKSFLFLILTSFNFHFLALGILLTQFTRSIYRGTKEMYAGDHKALGVTLMAIFRGYQKAYTPLQTVFMPCMVLSCQENLHCHVCWINENDSVLWMLYFRSYHQKYGSTMLHQGFQRMIHWEWSRTISRIPWTSLELSKGFHTEIHFWEENPPKKRYNFFFLVFRINICAIKNFHRQCSWLKSRLTQTKQ